MIKVWVYVYVYINQKRLLSGEEEVKNVEWENPLPFFVIPSLTMYQLLLTMHNYLDHAILERELVLMAENLLSLH